MTAFTEHTRAVVTADFPEEGVQSGDVGVVVWIHNGGEGYELEFRNGAVVTVRANQVRALGETEMLRVRSEN